MMEETNSLPGVYQFERRLKFGRLEIEAIGGPFWGVGLSVVVERSPFYYGLFAIRLVILCLFFDATFFWTETPLEDTE